MALKWPKIDLQAVTKANQFGAPVLTFCINVRPPANVKSELRSLLSKGKAVVKSGGFSQPQKKNLTAQLAAIEKAVLARQSIDGVSSILFFAGSDSFSSFTLPVALPSRCVVDVVPYVRDISAAMDRFAEYGLLLLDSNHARFFNFYLGEVDQEILNITQKLPQNVSRTGNYGLIMGKKGFAKGMRTAKVQAHVLDHLHHYLQGLSDTLKDRFNVHEFDHWLVGGRAEIISEFYKHLHPYLKNRLLGHFTADIKGPLPKINKKALEVINSHESVLEKEVLEKMEKQSGPGGKSVMGVYETANALMLGEVHRLFMIDEFRSPGFICVKDKFVASRAKDCDICEQPLTKTADLGNILINLALRQKADVKHIFYPDAAMKRQQVSAVLRYAI